MSSSALVDTHCHINMMVKKTFDILLTTEEIHAAQTIMQQAQSQQVTMIINVGTSFVESQNCVSLAQAYKDMYASIGIHPNDLKKNYLDEIKAFEALLKQKEKNKIIAIGEIGFDKHYSNYNIKQQKDAFRAQVELALTYQLPIIIHSRQAPDETIRGLEEFEHDNVHGIVHCFSEDLSFAHEVISRNFLIGIGGTLTYPANDTLREVCQEVSLEKIVLETDAPFLPPQIIRGQQNSPKYISHIAQYLANLRGITLEQIAQQTTKNVKQLFQLNDL